MIAGERDGWDYVWPRDAAAGAIALEAAGLRPEAGRVAGFLDGLDLDAARFYPDGDRVPGRTAAGDEEGWVEAADRAGHAGVVGTVRSMVVRRPKSRTVPGLARSSGLRRERRPATCSATRSPRARRPPKSSRASGPRGAWCESRALDELDSVRGMGGHRLPQPGFAWNGQEDAVAADPRVDAPTASLRSRAGRRVRCGRRPRRGRPGRWPGSATPVPRIASCGSSGAQRRRTGRSPSEWMRARANQPRPRPSPGRTPSRSWRCGPAIPASRRSPGDAVDDRAASTASSGVSASVIPRSVPAWLRSFQLWIATTGLPSRRAKAISESVPHSPPIAITASPGGHHREVPGVARPRRRPRG